MPTLDQLASNGLKYNNFHTTALCSPTRMALKTGRNHHQAETGSIMETATSFPAIPAGAQQRRAAGGDAPAQWLQHRSVRKVARDGSLGDQCLWAIRSLADESGLRQVLRLHRWRDEPVGAVPVRWHHPSRAPSRSQLPLHDGHDEQDRRVDKASAGDDARQAVLRLLRPGATHAPHQVPKDWIARWKGKFDKGWDKLREETLERQIKLGVVPAGTPLAKKPEAIKDWDKLSADEQRLFARQAEVFAAFAEMTDYEIGRVIKSIEDMGELDNTLILYIAGDNGASAEGGAIGMFNEMSYFNGVQEQLPDLLKLIDKWGGPETYAHMAAGWAVALNAPFMWTKQVASSYGGTRNGMVVHWPKGIKAKGEVRSQFHHVIDVAPTILEAAKLPEPKSVNGTPQVPMAGVSMAYTFDDKAAKDRRTTQYFEIFGNRAVYHDGWLAGTIHKAPWEANRAAHCRTIFGSFTTSAPTSALPRTSLRRTRTSWLNCKHLFMKEAEKYNVLPIDDRGAERVNAELAGRPDIMAGRTSLALAEGMTGMMENVFINVKNKSKTITAEIEVFPARPRTGRSLRRAVGLAAGRCT